MSAFVTYSRDEWKSNLKTNGTIGRNGWQESVCRQRNVRTIVAINSSSQHRFLTKRARLGSSRRISPTARRRRGSVSLVVGKLILNVSGSSYRTPFFFFLRLIITKYFATKCYNIHRAGRLGYNMQILRKKLINLPRHPSPAGFLGESLLIITRTVAAATRENYYYYSGENGKLKYPEQ